MRFRSSAVALSCALLVLSPARMHAQPAAAADSVGLHAAATAFLTAFDAVDWEPFARAWAPEATVFMPDGDKQRRYDGRDTVLAYFRELFAAVRQRAGAGAGTPSLNILARVRDLRVVPIGPDAGVVTFHLGDDAAPGRRTVVWRRVPASGRWEIVHLHASRFPPPAPPR